MKKLSHKKMQAWQLSMILVKDIYILSESFPKTEIFGLTSQLKRAAVSVPSNIAEGASRISKLERKRFYEIARSSIVEIDTQLLIAVNLKFASEDSITSILGLMNRIFGLLSRMIKNPI